MSTITYYRIIHRRRVSLRRRWAAGLASLGGFLAARAEAVLCWEPKGFRELHGYYRQAA